MKELGRKIANLLSRGEVALINAASKMQLLQVALLADETKDDVEHFEPYGFTSHPHPGAEALTVFIEGDRSHGIAIVCADRRYRLTALEPGEVALHDDLGHVVKLSRTGIAIDGGGHNLTIANAPQVLVSGGDVLADDISLKHHHHNEHDGPATSQAIA